MSERVERKASSALVKPNSLGFKLLKVLTFERFAVKPTPYAAPNKPVRYIYPQDYPDMAGPGARMMIENFMALKPDPLEDLEGFKAAHPDQYEAMQTIMAGYLQLVQDKRGQWVAPDELGTGR